MNHKNWSDYSVYFKDINLKAGFTNNSFKHSKPTDRIEFTKLLGLNSDNIIKPIQVHSNNVIECYKSGEYKDTDGVFSQDGELVLSIQVADCIPIFIFDSNTKYIGLIHAGWRGISKSIVKSITDELERHNSKIKDLQVLLGPSIRQCCFEIGPEVAELFNKKFLVNGDGDRSFLDLQGFVSNQFVEKGFKVTQIVDINECTHCSGDYHSYRRDGKKAGRMIAMMGFKR